VELTEALRTWLHANHKSLSASADDETLRLYAQRSISDGTLSAAKLAELTDAKSPDARDVFGSLRVKRASERYSTSKAVGKHSKTGEPVRNERGQFAELPSELEYAKAGALFKHIASKSGAAGIVLTEHESALLADIAERDEWAGEVNGEFKLFAGTKALLDDVSSGGLEAAPIFFDEMLIQYPLLNGELLPFVDLSEVPRGRPIEGAAVGNPTVVWGTGEGTEAALFDTADLVTALNTTVFPVTCAVEVGLDFLSDSPADVGRRLTENVGQKMLTDLDRVIAVGNGNTEPQGMFSASGTTAVPSTNGNGGPPTVADYESLLFAVGKQYRNRALRPAFVANDTTYARARGIAVSGSDQRRVFGLEHSTYTLLEQPFKVQNDLPNTKVAFGALAKYRMYRRIGQAVKFETGGKELTRKNLGLLVVRGRYGGRVVDPNAFAVMTDAKS